MMDFFRRMFIGKKLKSDEPLDRVHFAFFLQKKPKSRNIKKILPLIEDMDWNVRNAASLTLIHLIEHFPETKEKVLEYLHDLIERSSLAIKLSTLEVLGKLKDYSSKPYLVKVLEESDYDLQYAAIRAIGYLDDVDMLYPLTNVVYAEDYITKRAAILSVIRISKSVKDEEQIEKLTPHIHIIIESYLELDQLGEIFCKILDYGDFNQFPNMKGYHESEIVKLEDLIEQKDYSVEMYQNFAKLIFPKYFPIAENMNL